MPEYTFVHCSVSEDPSRYQQKCIATWDTLLLVISELAGSYIRLEDITVVGQSIFVNRFHCWFKDGAMVFSHLLVLNTAYIGYVWSQFRKMTTILLRKIILCVTSLSDDHTLILVDEISTKVRIYPYWLKNYIYFQKLKMLQIA